MDRKTIGDFPRPESLPQGRLRSLRTLHATAAGGFAAALSELLRSAVEVDLAGVDQLPYGKFLARLGNTTHFNQLRSTPPGDSLLLDVEPSILYPMIDRLLGGGAGDEPPPRRPLSDLELPLAARIVRLFLEQLRLAWINVVDMKLEVVQVESNPRLLRALPADELVVSVDFQLTVGSRLGMMRLCIPCRTIQRLDKMRLPGTSANPSVFPPPNEEAPTETDSAVEASVTLAATSTTAAELVGLQVGDIIATETEAGSPAVVSLAGEPKFRAKPGACRGRKAVCITEPVGDNE